MSFVKQQTKHQKLLHNNYLFYHMYITKENLKKRKQKQKNIW